VANKILDLYHAIQVRMAELLYGAVGGYPRTYGSLAGFKIADINQHRP
jgi:hypothetical protein